MLLDVDGHRVDLDRLFRKTRAALARFWFTLPIYMRRYNVPKGVPLTKDDYARFCSDGYMSRVLDRPGPQITPEV
jgi:hypothetical protein